MLSRGNKVALFVAAVATLTIVWNSTSYVSCAKSGLDEVSEQQDIKDSTSFLRQLRLAPVTDVQCIGEFLEANNGVITGVSTAFLAWITYLLVVLGRGQEKTSRAQLRAYVMVGTATISNIIGDKMPVAKIQIKNFGQTPAYNLNAGISMGFAKWPFQDVEWPTFVFVGEKRSERPIAPGDDFPLLIDLGKALSAEQVAAIYGGRWALWVAGKVIYKDAFDNPRETEFCFFTTKITGVGMLAAVEGRNKST